MADYRPQPSRIWQTENKLGMIGDNEWFFDNCTPAIWARPTILDWEVCESAIDVSLPSEFKSIINFVGIGYFGDLFLFNPNQMLNSEVRLPDASVELHRWLYENALYSKIELDLYWESPSTSAIVLGDVNGDEYLFWNDSGWFFIDTETFECRFIGKSLISYLVCAYRFYRNGIAESDEGLWERYENSSQDYDLFFSPTPDPCGN